MGIILSELTKKMNLDVADKIISEKGVTFCGRNLVEICQCKPEYIEEALNEAGYYSEDGDFSDSDLSLICGIVDDFGSELMSVPRVLEKQVWFDEK